MDEAEHCHRLAFIQHGSIIATGTSESIKQETIFGMMLELDCVEPARALMLLKEAQKTIPIKEVVLNGALIHIHLSPEIHDHHRTQKSIFRYLKSSGLDSYSLNLIEPTLEDVFIASMRTAQKQTVGG
jgi:ABC-type multidrug transport system ATPase subunit